MTYYAKQNYDDVLAGTSESIERDKRNLLAFSVRGDDYYAKQDDVNSIVDYTRAIELNSQFGVAYGNRANAYDSTMRRFASIPLRKSLIDFPW